MQRVSFMFKIRPEHIAEYQRWHREIWPEMLAALSASGYHNYSLFMRESDGMVFGYYETPDAAAAGAAMAQQAVNTRWQQAMEPFFDTLENGQRVAALTEVFHLD